MLEPLLLKPSRVARLIDVSPKVLRAMVARGEIPSRRLGGKVMIPATEFRTWLDSLPGVNATHALTALGQRAVVAGYPNTRVEVE